MMAARAHISALKACLGAMQLQFDLAEAWGVLLAKLLPDGHRLLVAGNGGSAAQAQHLTAELVGRFKEDRPPFSAIPLHGDSSSLTAIGNDYGFEEVFARGVRAHGREGDVLLLISTSGASANLLAAARAARSRGLRSWALTGPVPNRLSACSDEAIGVPHTDTAIVQEAHLISIHLVCAAFDRALIIPDRPAVVVT
jgi:D-sedoheptulose 7-phosphate isomerase